MFYLFKQKWIRSKWIWNLQKKKYQMKLVEVFCRIEVTKFVRLGKLKSRIGLRIQWKHRPSDDEADVFPSQKGESQTSPIQFPIRLTNEEFMTVRSCRLMASFRIRLVNETEGIVLRRWQLAKSVFSRV